MKRFILSIALSLSLCASGCAHLLPVDDSVTKALEIGACLSLDPKLSVSIQDPAKARLELMTMEIELRNMQLKIANNEAVTPEEVVKANDLFDTYLRFLKCLE